MDNKKPTRETKATRQAKLDLRNNLAKARDEFLESDEGKMLSMPNILKDNKHQFYLENRLVAAFVAGWEARK